MMDMKSNSKPKNLIGEEETPQKENAPQKVTLTLEGFLTQMGVEWEQKGRAVYIYPSSLQEVKELIEKMPLPDHDKYAIVPMGSIEGYTVFVMVSRNGVSVRIGYARNSIPFSPTLLSIVEKLTKVTKEIGIDTRKSGKNLLG